MSILEECGPSLGIFINLSKCEVFSLNDPHSFPAAMKTSHLPHMVILGAPIGDYLFCATFIASKRLDAEKLLSKLVEVATIDPQVALILLRVCGSFCKLIHLARATPPSLVSDPLQLFDNDVRQCFKDCFVFDTSDSTWQQVQLSLRYGGLGLRSLSHHSSAALIASVCSSGFGDRDNPYLVQAINLFNIQVLPSDAISVESVLSSPIKKRTLSQKLNNRLFQTFLVSSSVANKARILSESAPHCASWLSVVPSSALGLLLEPNEFLVALKWWLGHDLSRGSLCPLCPDTALDPLGHHAVTCRRGGDVVMHQ